MRERPSGVVLIALVAVWAAVLVRALTLPAEPGVQVAYAAGLSAFLLILLVVLLRRPGSSSFLHAACALQTAIVLVLLALNPERDFLTVLLLPLCYQAAFVFSARMRVAWVATLVTLIGASLILELGLLRGLALSLVPMAAGIVLSTYAVVSAELEAARARSERMVSDLQTAQRRLRDYAAQVDELAAIEERSRLARALQASVSETLASALAVSASARQRLDDPDSAAPQLEQLQALAQQALAQMRRIITELRPAPAAGPAGDASGASLRER